MTLNQKIEKILRCMGYTRRILKELRDSSSFMAREARLPRRPISKIFRDRQALRLCVSLLDKGYTYKFIADELNRRIKNFKTSKSAIGRFRTLYIKTLNK
jgi:DNA-binding NarL/FixJ family response regulator